MIRVCDGFGQYLREIMSDSNMDRDLEHPGQ